MGKALENELNVQDPKIVRIKTIYEMALDSHLDPKANL